MNNMKFITFRAQVLTVRMRQLFDRPNDEILEVYYFTRPFLNLRPNRCHFQLQEEMAMLDLAVRYLSHSLAQEEGTI